MQRYVQLYADNLAGERAELLGSDGVAYLDGRLGGERQLQEAEAYYQRMKRLKPNVNGWAIINSSRFIDSLAEPGRVSRYGGGPLLGMGGREY